MVLREAMGQNGLSARSHEDEEPSYDNTLLARIELDHDAEALAELYDRHSVGVYSLLLHITGLASAAERFTKELFLRIWRCDAELEGLSPRTWLLREARKLGLEFGACAAGQLDWARENGDDKRRRRTALELAYFCGLSYSEIAETIGVPSAVVRRWVRQELVATNGNKGRA